MTKMPEKEEEQKLCDQFEEKLYVKMKEFLEEDDDTREYIVGKFNQINEATDALSQILSDYLNKNALSDEERKKLLYCMGFSIAAYITRQVITDTIDKEINKQCLAKAAFDCIDIEKCIGVKATNGEKVVVAVIPKELIKDKNDEEIIEFAKTMPNFQEDDLKDAQFEILRGEELKNDFSKAQEIVINGVTRPTEEEQCQK